MSGSPPYANGETERRSFGRRRWIHHPAFHLFYAGFALWDFSFAARAERRWAEGHGWFYLFSTVFDLLCGLGMVVLWVAWTRNRRPSDVR